MTYTTDQRRKHIYELQRYLYTISIFDSRIPYIIPDGIYGKSTALAVRAFQGAYNLKVTGETDRMTWDKIVSVYRNYVNNNAAPISIFPRSDYIYRKGDSGLGVSIIQSVLLELSKRFSNMKSVQITSVFDAQTESAVLNLQNQTNLPMNGQVNNKTWNVMAGTLK